jgi:ABC-type metal ion transport system substrate-binding protein
MYHLDGGITRMLDKENSAIQKLINILTGPEVKEFIEDNYKGGVIPAF